LKFLSAATLEGQELYLTDFENAAALFHSLIKNHPFIDETKRTAFASAIFFLQTCGYTLPEQFPVNEVVEFCVSIAEENLRRPRGDEVTVQSISEIAAWLQRLLLPPR
jgi:death on curing protein